MPELPTVAESGVPGFESFTWLGLFVPAGTPKEIVARIGVGILRVVNLPEVRERLIALGGDPAAGAADQLAARLAGDIAKYARIIRDSGYKAE